jgi:hypothetical protein
MNTQNYSSSRFSKRNKEMSDAPRKENPLVKDWIIHNMSEGITSVIRFVSRTPDGNYHVAVSRALKSVFDKMYSRPEGRRNALKRMSEYYLDYRRNYLKRSYDRRKALSVDVKVPFCADKKVRERVTKTIFVVGPETVLNLHEMEVWSNTILPKIEEVLS